MPNLYADGGKKPKRKPRYTRSSPVTVTKPDGTSEVQPPYDLIDLYRVRGGKKPRKKRQEQ